MKERERAGVVFHDRLYGEFVLPEPVRSLLETREFTRLHRVSLEATPAGFSPTGTASSKAEHSVGAAHLAQILVGKSEFKDHAQNILFATALHDVATPPFSHTCDHFVEERIGFNHEGWAEEIILGSSRLRKVISEHEGNPEVVVGIITGKEKPLSDLVNGTIDLDNLDNSLRYGVSMGVLHNLAYDPEKLAERFGMGDGQVVLQVGEKDLEGWQRVRQDIYEFVYSEAHLSPAIMLYRALELLHKDDLLPDWFFRLTDEEALEFILRKQHRGSFALVEDALYWRHYPLVFDRVTQSPSDSERTLTGNWKGRSELASRIEKEFGIKSYEVCVYTGRDKGYRKIHLPLLDEEGNVWRHNPPEDQTNMIKVFVHPKHEEQREKIQSFCQELLNSDDFVAQSEPSQTGY